MRAASADWIHCYITCKQRLSSYGVCDVTRRSVMMFPKKMNRLFLRSLNVDVVFVDSQAVGRSPSLQQAMTGSYSEAVTVLHQPCVNC